MMRFNWQPIETAPRDGSIFVHLGIVVYGAMPTDPDRPITIGPHVDPLYRAWLGERPVDGRGGYWMQALAQCSFADQHVRHWMSVARYRSALEGLPTWRSAPTDRAVIFVRPIESAAGAAHDPPDVYDALAVWWQPDGWRGTRTFGRTTLHPGYLDGENVLARPFLWCELDDFLPKVELDCDAEIRRRQRSAREDHLRGTPA